MRTAHHESAFADAGKDRETIAVVEEWGALAGVLEQADCVRIVVRRRRGATQRERREGQKRKEFVHDVSPYQFVHFVTFQLLAASRPRATRMHAGCRRP